MYLTNEKHDLQYKVDVLKLTEDHLTGFNTKVYSRNNIPNVYLMMMGEVHYFRVLMEGRTPL